MNAWACLAVFLAPSIAVGLWLLVTQSIRAVRHHD